MADQEVTNDNVEIVDLTKYTIADFFAMTLSDLRDVAAFFGVKAPTKRAKKELVEMIYAVKSGVAPQGKPKKKGVRGRPSLTPDRQYYMDWGTVKTTSDTENTTEFTNGPTSISSVNDVDDYVFDEDIEDDEEIVRDTIEYFGTLDIVKQGSYGFLRANKYKVNNKDPYISGKLIKKFNLRQGDFVGADINANGYSNSPAVINVTTVNGKYAKIDDDRPDFDQSCALHPEQRYYVNDINKPTFATRTIDLCCPIAKGQRSVIFAEANSRKLDLVKQVACGIKANHPYVSEYVLILDEMPEDVTDLQNALDAEIACAHFYDSAKYRLRIARMLLESAKRQVEQGKDVVVIVDTLTNLIDAYNQVSSGGRTFVGGLNSEAIQKAKKFLGAGKNIDGGGSLTMIAIADVKEEDQIDSVIYSQFHGLGNMELMIKGNAFSLPFAPYVDIARSYVQGCDMFLEDNQLAAYRIISENMRQDSSKTADTLISMLMNTKDNKTLIKQIIAKRSLIK